MSSRYVDEVRRAERAAREERVLELHREGLSLALIGTRLGLSRWGVRNVLMRAGLEPVGLGREEW